MAATDRVRHSLTYLTWSANFCYVFTDDLQGGMRSGSTLLEAINGTSVQLIVAIELGVGYPAQFAGPGEILVGDERIGYQRHVVSGGRHFFKEITRAAGGTTAADHAAGTVVRWLVDPDEATTLIVAHEAGHNVHLTHDKTDDSIMTQVKGGQTSYDHNFRHLGAKAGSTQEFRVK